VQEIIYGVRPVVEALKSRRRRVLEVLDAVGDRSVKDAAGGVPVKKVPAPGSRSLARGGVHQGVAARVEPYPYSGLEEIVSVPSRLSWCWTASRTRATSGGLAGGRRGRGERGGDPEGPGRGRHGGGGQGERGASEHARVARETNLRRAIDRMKEAGIWVYAAEVGGTPHTELDLSGPVALVLGSEGRGRGDWYARGATGPSPSRCSGPWAP
jgi:23S rRNA (guanosine2251-2'-O)-methyltransferase